MTDGDSVGESSSEHPNPSGSDGRSRITTNREPREVRDEQPTVIEQHVPRRILGKTTPKEHAVAVTTQAAPGGYREKTMRIESVENSLNWVSISSAGALDMTHYDISAKTARDEMRHIIGGSEPDFIIGSDKDQNRGCKKRDKDHLEFLCELHEAQEARGRHFVHELTSEVNSKTGCVLKIVAMRGTRTAVHVRTGRVRQGRTRFRQRERANDYQRETGWSTIAEQVHA